MQPQLQPRNYSAWHGSPRARALLAKLGPSDVRLARAPGGPGPDGLAWRPVGDFGTAIFEALSRLRETAIGPAFTQARDGPARAAALALAQHAPSVAGAITTRFGDPNRWRL